MAVLQHTTSALDQRNTDDGRTLLERFAAARRSYVANTFLYTVRAGARTPLQVLAAVNETLRETHARSQRWSFTDTVQRTEEVMAVLREYHAEAMAFAAWALAWEALSPAEKERQKAAKGAAHRQTSMEQQPPTDKQRAYLAALGYHGEISSKAHASELIDQLRSGKLGGENRGS